MEDDGDVNCDATAGDVEQRKALVLYTAPDGRDEVVEMPPPKTGSAAYSYPSGQAGVETDSAASSANGRELSRGTAMFCEMFMVLRYMREVE